MTLTIEGYASTWGGPDLQGDYIEMGAYTRTLENWRRRSSSNPGVYLVDSHEYAPLHRVIGRMMKAKEDDVGLLCTFEFVPEDPDAKAAFQRYESGIMSGLSIGYDVIRYRMPGEQERSAGVRRVLQELRLYEVSCVTFPANPKAVVIRSSSGEKTRYLQLERAQRKLDEERIRQAGTSIERALSRRKTA